MIPRMIYCGNLRFFSPVDTTLPEYTSLQYVPQCQKDDDEMSFFPPCCHSFSASSGVIVDGGGVSAEWWWDGGGRGWGDNTVQHGLN